MQLLPGFGPVGWCLKYRWSVYLYGWAVSDSLALVSGDHHASGSKSKNHSNARFGSFLAAHVISHTILGYPIPTHTLLTSMNFLELKPFKLPGCWWFMKNTILLLRPIWLKAVSGSYQLFRPPSPIVPPHRSRQHVQDRWGKGSKLASQPSARNGIS